MSKVATYIARVYRVDIDRFIVEIQSRFNRECTFKWNLLYENISSKYLFMIPKIKENSFIKFDLTEGARVIKIEIFKKPIHRPFLILKPKSP